MKIKNPVKYYGARIINITVHILKGRAMQIEKALINDPLSVLKVSVKFCIPTMYSFAVIYP